ncbi:hypothetical protein BJ980_002363 [Nocardioides daedukensis]|uniref:Uncharacterized protein n=1 Tax=Nocardioides daedukensis TaxID=634462 RepID=A0A7Y9S030_9ACTN|nr:hypothetical protein [Nocardioides daedukensis]NYG59440.1 hypothetical protein [Nocardioides daedukensis]
MNDPHPGTPPSGQGGFPPAGQGGFPPPGQFGYPPAGHYPPPRKGSGRTLIWLAAGLVLVVAVIGIVALLVRGGGDSEDKADDGPRGQSCATYQDVVLSSEMWSATEFDPDRLQEMYDTVLEDITDEEIESLVSEEATVVVDYYRAIGEWKQSMEDALSRGETPETTIPAELQAQQADIPRTQAAVREACREFLPQAEDGPAPSITARPLVTPSPMGDN